MKNIDSYNLSNNFATIDKFQDKAEKFEMTDEKKEINSFVTKIALDVL
ncbi:MAG: hypothetical protein RO257_10035 [Candidatus Kapabacteria bacterium]|jgi:hypothetical protein|nr:hypothetical protein [Candidatus Kapabacteria bacterium]